jgi:enoyl-CoA hydratase/carnithine racemase
MKQKLLKFYVKDGIAVNKAEKNVLETLTYLSQREEFEMELQKIKERSDIKAILFLNAHDGEKEKEYEQFLSKILDRDEAENTYKKSDALNKRKLRTRQLNLLNQYIMYMIEFEKLIFTGLNGSIVTPLFGLSLAMDFRYATEDMKFSLAHIKYNLHPSGALPYFLPKYVSRSKAIELLMRGEDIPAEKALELGLINKILPKDDFENACIEEAKKICKIDVHIMDTTKKLISYNKNKLQKYFDYELESIHTMKYNY